MLANAKTIAGVLTTMTAATHQKQIADQLTDASGGTTAVGRQLELLDMSFTIVFTIELLITAFAQWFRCPANPLGKPDTLCSRTQAQAHMNVLLLP